MSKNHEDRDNQQERLGAGLLESSETKCCAPQVVGEDIVRTTTEVVEPAEMTGPSTEASVTDLMTWINESRVQVKVDQMLEQPKALDTVLLGSENSKDATMANQQERLYAFGYVLGVYFGDGSIGTCGSKYIRFQVQAVDLEFIEKLRQQAKILLRKGPASIQLAKPKRTNRQAVYAVVISGNRFFSWVKKVTNGKKVIPPFVFRNFDILKGFLEGVFDSEGSVNAICVASEQRVRWVFQFSVIEPWAKDIFEVLRTMGVRNGNFNTYQPKKTNEQKRYLICIPLQDFVQTRLEFVVNRKRLRLDLFKRILRDYTSTAKPISRLVSHDIVRTMLRDIDVECERLRSLFSIT